MKMFIAFALLVLCLLALWWATDSRDQPVRSAEDDLARHGMTWQSPDDPLAYELAAEIRTRQLRGRQRR
jgi:hypothetical protein